MTNSALPSLKTLLRRRDVQVVLILSLMLRLAIAVIPSVPHYTNDSDGYISPGVNLFAHASFAMTCDPRCIPTLWRTPGYPIIVGLLVGALKLPLAVVYVLQTLMDTLTTLLVASMGWSLGGRRTGTIAAASYGLNPFAAVFAGQIMTEAVTTFAIMGAIYLLWRMREEDRPTRRRICWIGLGLLLGFATLTRPVLAPFPALLAIAAFERDRWREQTRGWVLAATAFALMVAPWIARNWLVTRDGGADDSFRVLGSMYSPFYRRIATPGVQRWYHTFEEPFAWDRPREAPFFARYFLPGEKERVEELFAGMRAAGVVVTPTLDAGFAELARERIEAHFFRTTVLPPLSKAARLWITPRLGYFGIESARMSGFGGRLLFVVATFGNAVLALLGFATGAALVRRVEARLLLALPVFLTGIHSFIMWGCQSRYSVPGLPQITILATLGGLFLLDRVKRAVPRPTT